MSRRPDRVLSEPGDEGAPHTDRGSEKRDHRQLGRELGRRCSTPGRPAQRSGRTRDDPLQDAANQMGGLLLPNGYVEVKTPLIFNKALWETSGHWSNYRQNMFLIVEGPEARARPVRPTARQRPRAQAMNCPATSCSYASDVRQLPRTCRSPARTVADRPQRGVGRAGRADARPPISQDHGHCFVTQEEIGDEVERLIGRCSRSTRTSSSPHRQAGRPAPEFLAEIATWDSAEAQLRTPGIATGRRPMNEGDGASTDRRSTSTSPTRSAGSGSARRFNWTTTCRSGSTRNTPAPTTPSTVRWSSTELFSAASSGSSPC